VRKIVASVDTASKKGERNDYTVIEIWLETLEGKHYLLDVIRSKLEFNEMCLEINKAALRWAVNAILVEDKGSGTQYIQTQTGKAPAPIIPIPTTEGSKEFRFDSITPMIEGGLVYLPEAASWLPDFEKEILSFPNGKHDDQVDAASQYLRWTGGKKAIGGTVKIQTRGGVGQTQRVKMVEAALQKEMERLADKKRNEESINLNN
jgi:predicted phage terminase large subunit-like protein